MKYVANQVFPTPAPLDILMDLAAHSSAFLQVSLSLPKHLTSESCTWETAFIFRALLTLVLEPVLSD